MKMLSKKASRQVTLSQGIWGTSVMASAPSSAFSTFYDEK